MRKGFFHILLFIVIFAPLGAAAAERPMMPAPEDRAAERYNEQKGATIQRDKWGVMDPTPSVIPLEYLPVDKYGFVDWAGAIKKGLITPKDSLSGKPSPPPSFNKDVLIRSKLKFMPDVIFPHSAHNEWLSCAVCHPKMFKKKAGANNISMLGIWDGRFCGRCHDKVAFPIRNCFKCHSVKDVDQRRRLRTKSMEGYRLEQKKLRPPLQSPLSGVN